MLCCPLGRQASFAKVMRMLMQAQASLLPSTPLNTFLSLARSAQTEIRDYNQQMEQKVNILMHILQTSTAPTPANSTQLQQQLSLAQPAPSASAMTASQPMPPAGMLTNCSSGSGAAGLSTGLLNQLSNNSSGAGGACVTGNSANLMLQARKDALLGSLGQQVRFFILTSPYPRPAAPFAAAAHLVSPKITFCCVVWLA